MKYPNLFKPIQIRGTTIRNRIVSSAHGTQLITDNVPNERLIRYHVERARGGVGLIVVEACRVHPTTVSHVRQPIGFERRAIPAYRELADAVHSEGAAIFAQILHQGRQLTSLDTRLPLWAPSAIPCPTNKEVPHEMTVAEIDEIVQAHAETAANLKEAGVDGIEIHAAHGYLLQEFMSAYSNVRTDDYGGSLDNRLRMPIRVVDAVREAVGADFSLGIRLSADEFTEGGLTLADMQDIAPRLVGRGLDFVSVSVSTYNGYSYATMIPDMHFAPGAFVYAAAEMKKALPGVPVMTVGRIIHPDQAEDILAKGAADMVIMTRALIADPELPRKAQEDREDDIRRCIGSTEGCVGMSHTGRPITCTVNPTAGSEAQWGIGTLARVPIPASVVVVGGGPAGMEAARVAAERGHRVVLYERNEVLGGQLAIASMAANRVEFARLVDWLKRELNRLGVSILLGVEATVDAVMARKPEAVIVATGSYPKLPVLEGAGPLQPMDVSDSLRHPELVGKRVVVLDNDRHFKAAGAAEFFADRGHEVVIATAGGEAGQDTVTTTFTGLRVRLGQKHVRTLPFHVPRRVNGQDLILVDSFSGLETHIRDVDTMVWAGPHVSDNVLMEELQGKVPVLVSAGDCVAPRRALDAMREGHAAGRRV